jgi:hypothetical protein
MDKIWSGIITKNKSGFQFFEIDDVDGFMVYMATFKPDDKLDIIVRKQQKLSSNPQNRYYYGVIVKFISEFTGHTPEEVDSILKWKFLKRYDDKGMEYVPSKNALTTAEREVYHDNCRRWAAIVLELNIPLPNEVEYE